MTLAEWELRYNLSPIETPAPWTQHIHYTERNYDLTLWYDGSPNQNIRDALIYEVYFHPQSIDSEEQHAEARVFLPADAQLQEIHQTITERGGYTAVYRSQSLAARYPPLPSRPDPWKGTVPGTIRVIYYTNGPYAGVEATLQEPLELHPPTEPPPTNTPFILLPTPLPTEPVPPLPMPSGVPTEPLLPMSEADQTAQPLPVQPLP